MSRSSVQVVRATPAHIGTIAARMRDVDVLEARCMGHTPKQALRLGLIGSTYCYTATVDGRAEAMFGLVVTSALGGEGIPWMLGTDAIYRHPREMLAWGSRVLVSFFDSSARLSNVIATRNTRAIRLLRRWGFEIGEEVIIFAGTEFVTFSRERR